jgi:hypothetical protein
VTEDVPRHIAERYADDPIVARMLERNLPLHRDTYLTLNWGPDQPDPWTAEHEGELPECFKDPSAVHRKVEPPLDD